MYPELLHLGPLTVHTYGVFYALGILAATGLAEHLYRRKGGSPGTVTDLALPTVLGVLVGARALFVLVEHEYFIRHPLQVFAVWSGGLVFYGGLAGGTAAFILTARRRGLELRGLADAVAPGVALGHGIGRLGCFFAGSCYGRPTDLPWAVTFTDPRSLAGGILGVPVHPTQLYSALFLFLLSAILTGISRRQTFNGQTAALYALSYGTFRFFVEFLRGDPRGAATLGGVTLSTAQWISVLLVPAALALYFYLSGKGGKDRGAGEILLQDGPGPSLQRSR